MTEANSQTSISVLWPMKKMPPFPSDFFSEPNNPSSQHKLGFLLTFFFCALFYFPLKNPSITTVGEWFGLRFGLLKAK